MKLQYCGLRLISTSCFLIATLPVVTKAASVASDNASAATYDDGWQTGDNGGSGWGGPWQLSLSNPGDGSQNGHFVGDSTTNGNPAGGPGINSNPGNRAWALYANTDQTSSAVRPFSGALSVGDTFQIDMDNGSIQTPQDLFGDGTVGFALQNSSGENVWEFFFVGGGTNYTVNAGSVVGGLPTFTNGGLHIEIGLTSSSAYQATITRLSDNTDFVVSGNLLNPLAGQAIDRLRLFNSNGGPGDEANLFFNNISIPEPNSSMLLLVGAAGISWLRRKQHR